MAQPIPITVIGGYLGAGKTTLLNRLLREPGGRRIGVIVNDFGSIGVDAELLDAATDTGVVNLPNGCICCTLGGDLFEALTALRSGPIPPDQIVIEASGVADPAAAAAWGTSDGFAPGGVIVLVAADSIRRQLRDRYVGGEVQRQLVGADMLVLTKTDLCDATEVDRAAHTIATLAPDTTVVAADLPIDAILGLRPESVVSRTGAASSDPEHEHDDRYRRWSWTGGVLDEEALRSVLTSLPAGILRLKGWVEVDSVGPHESKRLLVQVVGKTVEVSTDAAPSGGLNGEPTKLVAIARAGSVDLDELTERFERTRPS